MTQQLHAAQALPGTTKQCLKWSVTTSCIIIHMKHIQKYISEILSQSSAVFKMLTLSASSNPILNANLQYTGVQANK